MQILNTVIIQELRDIQAEQNAWMQHCFGPNQPLWHCVYGMVEEYGEAMQNIQDRTEYLDAIGDTAIFFIGYCNIHAWDVGSLWACRDSTPSNSTVVQVKEGRPWPQILGKICHHELKMSQKIRGTRDFHNLALQEYCAALLGILERECELNGTTFIEVVRGVWSEVKKRDWAAMRVEKNWEGEE